MGDRPPGAGALPGRRLDGVVLSSIFECSCGAVDRYELDGASYLGLTSGILAAVAGDRGRVVFGESRLWDQTVVRRPSQALARLRELAREAPSGEAWRRLGNACERYGRIDQALDAWRRALEVDPAEIEAACWLANRLLPTDEGFAEGFACLSRGFSALPKATLGSEAREGVVHELVALLQEVLGSTSDPLALLAAWPVGPAALTVSSIDLRKLRRFDRLEEFLTAQELASVGLTSELPEDEPTILGRLLDHAPAQAPGPRRGVPVRTASRVGRNDACPCGSGRKHKRCCGA